MCDSQYFLVAYAVNSFGKRFNIPLVYCIDKMQSSVKFQYVYILGYPGHNYV